MSFLPDEFSENCKRRVEELVTEGHSIFCSQGQAWHSTPCQCPKDSPNTPQPMPVNNDHPAVWDLVMSDIQERDAIGQHKYNTRLQPFNGRKTLVDLYQELLDAVVYTRLLIYEQGGR